MGMDNTVISVRPGADYGAHYKPALRNPLVQSQIGTNRFLEDFRRDV